MNDGNTFHLIIWFTSGTQLPTKGKRSYDILRKFEERHKCVCRRYFLHKYRIHKHLKQKYVIKLEHNVGVRAKVVTCFCQSLLLKKFFPSLFIYSMKLRKTNYGNYLLYCFTCEKSFTNIYCCWRTNFPVWKRDQVGN